MSSQRSASLKIMCSVLAVLGLLLIFPASAPAHGNPVDGVGHAIGQLEGILARLGDGHPGAKGLCRALEALRAHGHRPQGKGFGRGFLDAACACACHDDDGPVVRGFAAHKGKCNHAPSKGKAAHAPSKGKDEHFCAHQGKGRGGPGGQLGRKGGCGPDGKGEARPPQGQANQSKGKGKGNPGSCVGNNSRGKGNKGNPDARKGGSPAGVGKPGGCVGKSANGKEGKGAGKQGGRSNQPGSCVGGKQGGGRPQASKPGPVTRGQKKAGQGCGPQGPKAGGQVGKGAGRRGPFGNNGVGNGFDPQPRGNPPINDGRGTGPGNPGNKGGPAFKGGGPAFSGGPAFKGGGPAFSGGPAFKGGGPAKGGGPQFRGGGGPQFRVGNVGGQAGRGRGGPPAMNRGGGGRPGGLPGKR